MRALPEASRGRAPVNPAPVTPPSTASEPDGGYRGGLDALAAPDAGPSVQTPAQTSPQAPLNLAPPPDLSGLAAAFVAAAGQPPVGVPSVADLPTPEQIAGALAGLPALPPLLPPPPS